jgi:hypothetical protein
LRHPPRTSSEGPTVSSQEHPPSWLQSLT